jgi:hypothetical protein
VQSNPRILPQPDRDYLKHGALETQRTNHGYLYRRLAPKRNDKAPDMEGEAWVDGNRYSLAGWVNISKRGKKYLGLKFTPADAELLGGLCRKAK